MVSKLEILIYLETKEYLIWSQLYIREIHFPRHLAFINRYSRMSRRLLLSLLLLTVVALDQTDGIFRRRRRRRRCESPPVNCVVGTWGSWSTCIEINCTGTGRQSRHRAVTTSPACGGMGCPPTSESRSCDPFSLQKRADCQLKPPSAETVRTTELLLTELALSSLNCKRFYYRSQLCLF